MAAYLGIVPMLTRWFLRAAMVNLVVGLALGVVLALPVFADVAAAWRPAYVHLLVMGWATQMIFGVALWMFPRKKPLDLTAIDWLGWSCFVGTNAGLLLRVLAEPALATGSWSLAGPVLLAAALLQLTAVACFVVLAWPRVMAR